jgi:molybdopterin synthase catalytic subunit
MNVRVRLFAGLRERAGVNEMELELPDGACVGDALEQLADVARGTRVVMAVNREYAKADAPLSAGDELALIPPVSGGAAPDTTATLTAGPISLDSLLDRVRDPRAGAVVTFQGVTREVAQLDYEAYEEMAAPRIAAIVEEAASATGHAVPRPSTGWGPCPCRSRRWPSRCRPRIAREAFAAAREIIDRIKAEVPIWKREEGEWVRGATPPSG